MKITLDKVAHFAVCFIIVVAIAIQVKAAGVLYDANIPNFVCGAIGADVALLLGAGKEAYDRLRGNKFDFQDLLADVAGIVFAFLCILGL